jgi:RNA polymerase sigma-70 factor (ECF subfamily)
MQPFTMDRRPTHRGGTVLGNHRDAADAARVLSGDIDAFESIVLRWQGPLVNLAFRFCRDRTRAEDLAQEALLKAFRGLASYRGDAAFSTWLIALAVNVCRSSLRRREPVLVGLEALGVAHDPLTADLALQRGDEARLVRAAVAELPRRLRDAILLYYFCDLDGSAAAGALGIPIGTLKARLYRGRELLRRRLGQNLGKQPGDAVLAEET